METTGTVLLLRERVCAVIAATLDVAVDRLVGTSLIAEDLGADSMKVIALMISLDAEFDVEFKIDRIPTSGVTVDWICEFVADTLSEAH
jgi:acyl carrier protein